MALKSPLLSHIFINPLRPPEWVWLRANGIYDGLEPPASDMYDGRHARHWINEAVQFINAYKQCETLMDASQLGIQHPEIYGAFLLFETRGTARDTLEASILARERRRALATRCFVSQKTIEAYEALFFDVRSRIRSEDVILHLILGPLGTAGLPAANHGTICKLFGYFLGPHALRLLATGFDPTVSCHSADESQSALRADTLATITIRAAVAAKTLTVNSSNQKFWVEQLMRAVEIEKMSKSSGQSNDQALMAIFKTLGRFQLNVGGHVPATGARAQLPVATAVFEQTAAELSQAESTGLALGMEQPQLKMLQDLKHPEQS